MRLLVLSIHSSTRQMRQSTNSLASLNSLLWNRITQGVLSKADFFFSSLENLTIHVSGSEGCSWSALRAHKDCSSRIKTILFVLPFISSEVHNTLSSPPCSSFSKIVLDLWGLSILRLKETGTVICSFWTFFLDGINWVNVAEELLMRPWACLSLNPLSGPEQTVFFPLLSSAPHLHTLFDIPECPSPPPPSTICQRADWAKEKEGNTTHNRIPLRSFSPALEARGSFLTQAQLVNSPR